MNQENIRTVSSYNWKGLSDAVAQSFVISISNESFRQPDPYFFWVDSKGIIDPKRGEYLFDILGKQNSTYLEKKEYALTEKLNTWAVQATEGYAIWFSPPFGDTYKIDGKKTGKVVIHCLSYAFGTLDKALDNSAIVFNANEEQFLKIVQKTFPELADFSDPEQLRDHLVVADKSFDLEKLLSRIKKYLPKSTEQVEIDKNAVAYVVDLVMRGAGSYEIAMEMQRQGLLGNNTLSCGGGLLGLVLGNSKVIDMADGGNFVRNCGNCGATINSVISAGYRCSSCGGTYEGC